MEGENPQSGELFIFTMVNPTPASLGKGLRTQACGSRARAHPSYSPTPFITQIRRVMPRRIHFSPLEPRFSEPRPRACAWEKDCHL